jgi:hypothetical protein
LDVEGSEFSFLQGAREMLEMLKPNIMIEINPISMKAADISEQQLKDLFTELGYTHFINTEMPDKPFIIDKLSASGMFDIILISNPSAD